MAPEHTAIDMGSDQKLIAPARLEVRGLEYSYGNKQVLFGIDLTVRPGDVVALLGHNGAGKTTILRCILGALKATGGQILLEGRDETATSQARRVRSGMAFVPADNFVFPDLTVSENLNLGGISNRSGSRRHDRLNWVLERWPILRHRGHQIAGTMSGGERRMLSLGMALMSEPSLLLLDEPSLGLAPKVVDDLFMDLRQLSDEDDLAVLLVEQSVAKALTMADDVYVAQQGRMIVHENADDFAARESWWQLF